MGGFWQPSPTRHPQGPAVATHGDVAELIRPHHHRTHALKQLESDRCRVAVVVVLPGADQRYAWGEQLMQGGILTRRPVVGDLEDVDRQTPWRRRQDTPQGGLSTRLDVPRRQHPQARYLEEQNEARVVDVRALAVGAGHGVGRCPSTFRGTGTCRPLRLG